MNNEIRNANRSVITTIAAFLLAQLIWGADVKEIYGFVMGAISVWVVMIWYAFLDKRGR